MDGEKDYLISSGRRGPRGSNLVTRVWRHDCLPCLPARYVLAVMGFLGFINVYTLRVNLSVAIVRMVNETANASTNLQYPWSDNEQGWALGAFYYGYLLTQIPGGWLSQRYGGKMVFGFGIVMTSILTLLTPLAAETSVWLLVAVRVAEGLFEGVTYPAMHQLWGEWAPLDERTRLVAFTYTGSYVGTVVSFFSAGVLCEYFGWPSVFYVTGIFGILWYVAWLLLGFSSPRTHPRISDVEKYYIVSSMKATDQEQVSTPWIAILTSPAVYGLTITHFCKSWGGYTLLSTMPTFFEEVLQLSSKHNIIINGLFSGIPFVAYSVIAFAVAPIADYLRGRWLSTTTVRKTSTMISLVGAAAGLIVTSYAPSNEAIAVTFLSVAVGMLAVAMAGVNVNHIDIAPKYAGVLMGITQMVGTVPGFAGPQVAKAMTPDGTREQWQNVFIISAELFLFGACIYLILGDGKKQWWSDGGSRKSSLDASSSVHFKKSHDSAEIKQ